MKPLADHGTTARAKGRPAGNVPPCPCRPCRDAENRYNKERNYLNATGRPRTVAPTAVAAHLETLFAAGAGWIQLAELTNCSASTLLDIRRRTSAVIRHDVAARILAVQPGQGIPPKRQQPALGTTRRIRALQTLGHSSKAISEASGVELSTVSDLLNEYHTTIGRRVAARIDTGYRQLAETAGTNTRARNRAAREGWAPPAAWDDIDDPHCHPDTTGHCGTDRGWWIHKSEELAPCLRCEEAHAARLVEMRALPNAQRIKLLAADRNAAVSRGLAIAENARELFRLGHGRLATAERLGVSASHLDHELVRHPAPSGEQELAA